MQSFLGDPSNVSKGEGRLTEDSVFYFKQVNCKHDKTQLYAQRRFDVLNGLEVTFTRCLNCHRIVALDAKKLTKP
jgi:hypothetical protein